MQSLFYSIDTYGVKNYTPAYKVLVCSLILFLIIIFGSALFLYVEKDVGVVKTYGDAVWFLYIAATTIGFGDFTAVSTAGRIITGIIVPVGGTMYVVIGTGIHDMLFRHTDTEIQNRELRAQNAKIIKNSEEIIRTNNLAVSSNAAILRKITKMSVANRK